VAPPENNPYSEQTEHNTRTEWLNEQEPLDVELDGLTDYAANMKTLSENLRDLGATLNPLGTVPTQAWEGMVLEEMNYMRHRFLGNYAEFKQYLANLQMALMNIGMAAQTIADALPRHRRVVGGLGGRRAIRLRGPQRAATRWPADRDQLPDLLRRAEPDAPDRRRRQRPAGRGLDPAGADRGERGGQVHLDQPVR
jgi:hypothetical protein